MAKQFDGYEDSEVDSESVNDDLTSVSPRLGARASSHAAATEAAAAAAAAAADDGSDPVAAALAAETASFVSSNHTGGSGCGLRNRQRPAMRISLSSTALDELERKESSRRQEDQEDEGGRGRPASPNVSWTFLQHLQNTSSAEQTSANAENVSRLKGTRAKKRGGLGPFARSYTRLMSTAGAVLRTVYAVVLGTSRLGFAVWLAFLVAMNDLVVFAYQVFSNLGVQAHLRPSVDILAALSHLRTVERRLAQHQSHQTATPTAAAASSLHLSEAECKELRRELMDARRHIKAAILCHYDSEEVQGLLKELGATGGGDPMGSAEGESAGSGGGGGGDANGQTGDGQGAAASPDQSANDVSGDGTSGGGPGLTSPLLPGLDESAAGPDYQERVGALGGKVGGWRWWLTHGWFADLRRAFFVAHDRFGSVPSVAERTHVRECVLNAPAVREAMAQETQQTEKSPAQVRARAEAIVVNMEARISLKIARLVCWFVAKTLAQFYPMGVQVDAAHVAKLRAVARTRPLVLLPTHRSHADYLIVSYMCLMQDLPLPHVVAGENLNIPVIGWILRHGGAFFIRRSFRSDRLYSALFHEYCIQLLIHGFSVECFIEGTRSRTGKVLAPRIGFLTGIVEAVRQGRLEDACVVPINISYDRIVEHRSYIHELTGASKQPERLSTFLSSVTSLIRDTASKKLCFGRIDIGIAEPISLRDYIDRSEAAARIKPFQQMLRAVDRESAAAAGDAGGAAIRKTSTAERTAAATEAAVAASAVLSKQSVAIATAKMYGMNDQTPRDDDDDDDEEDIDEGDNDDDGSQINASAKQDAAARRPMKASGGGYESDDESDAAEPHAQPKNGVSQGTGSGGGPDGVTVEDQEGQSVDEEDSEEEEDEEEQERRAMELKSGSSDPNNPLVEAIRKQDGKLLPKPSSKYFNSGRNLIGGKTGGLLSRSQIIGRRPVYDSHALANRLGYRVMWDMNSVSKVLPTSLVGTILLTQYERGIHVQELVTRVLWLQQEVIARGGEVVQQEGLTLTDSIAMVVDRVLGADKGSSSKGGEELVKRHKNILLLKLYSPAERMELSLLRNQLIHHFVSEALVAVSIYAIEKLSSSKTFPVAVPHSELYSKFEWLAGLLNLEFIYNPVPPEQRARSKGTAYLARFSRVITRMVARGILTQSRGLAKTHFSSSAGGITVGVPNKTPGVTAALDGASGMFLNTSASARDPAVSATSSAQYPETSHHHARHHHHGATGRRPGRKAVHDDLATELYYSVVDDSPQVLIHATPDAPTHVHQQQQQQQQQQQHQNHHYHHHLPGGNSEGTLSADNTGDNRRASGRDAAQSDDSHQASGAVVDEDGLPMSQRGGTMTFLFLCALLWPFIDSYWLASLTLLRLLPKSKSTMASLVARAQSIGEMLYFEGQVDLYEAISKDTVSNAFRQFKAWGVLVPVVMIGDNVPRDVVTLADAYRSREKLEAFIYRIGQYKKRSRAYSSRRYRARRAAFGKSHDVGDAIMAVMEMTENERN